MKTALLALLFTGALLAQAVDPAPDTTYPKYSVAMGGGYSTNAAPQGALGWLSMSIGIGGGYFSTTTLNTTAKYSTLDTGFEKIMNQSGNVTISALATAGISTPVPTIGTFAGGVKITFNMKGFSAKLDGLRLLGLAQINGSTSATPALPNQVFPTYRVGFQYDFR